MSYTLDTHEKILNKEESKETGVNQSRFLKEYLVIPEVQWGPNRFIQNKLNFKNEDQETARFNKED